MKITRYLIVRSSSECRIVSAKPHKLSITEFAFEINITIPERRQIIAGALTLEVPEFPEARVAAEMYEAAAQDLRDADEEE